jgi:hypothetical protein
MRPSSVTLGLTIPFSFLRPTVPEDGHIRPKYIVNKKKVWYICTMNCVNGNDNKALSYTEYDNGVHFLGHVKLNILNKVNEPAT